MSQKTAKHQMNVSTLRDLLEIAAHHGSVSLDDNALASLVKKISFSLDLRNTIRESETCLFPKMSRVLRNVNPTIVASDLRHKLEMGDIEPIFHLPAIISNKLRVYVFTLENVPIRGACTLVDGGFFIFLPSISHIDRLYTCARHLGYLLSAKVTDIDKAFSVFESTTKNTCSPMSAHERFADSFALELLIPNRGLGIALKEVRNLLRVSSGPIGDIELLYVSRIFGVGFLELARRCERAELLPRGGATSMYEFLVKKFGGPEPRARDLQLPPRPMTSIPPIPSPILHATVDRIRNGAFDIEEAAMSLGCSATLLKQTLYHRSTLH